MPFCRRCGDICNGERCKKCGGTVVSAALRWNADPSSSTKTTDKNDWANKFLSKADSHSNTSTLDTTNPKPARKLRADDWQTNVRSSARFNSAGGKALPSSSATSVPLFTRSTSQLSSFSGSSDRSTPSIARTPSPAKSLSHSFLNPDSPDPTIVLKPDNAAGGSLAKVYGSVLQPVSSLASFVCNACDAPFLPDATIYPALEGDTKRYFCRPCFTENGGSRGPCDACGKDVLRLKVEGGFVENDGRVWHSRCFKCEGCMRDVSTRPMVDVLGRPCCEDCFDGCLNRGKGSARNSRNPSPASKAVRSNGRVTTPSRTIDHADTITSPTSNPGGLRKSTSYSGMTASSPVVEELTRRIKASPMRKESRDIANSSPRFGAEERDDTLRARSIASRLASLSSESSSPGRETKSLTNRFAAADFSTPPARLSHSISALSLNSSTSSPPGPDPNTPTKLSTSKKPENSLSPPRHSNIATSGLLTPSSTPTQSPTRTPPARTVNIASPPGSISKIPSLRGRQSLSGVTSPPRARGPPLADIFSTPTRVPSGSKTNTPTSSKIPSVSAPKAPTPSKSPQNSVTKGKSSRPSLTIPISDVDMDAKCTGCETSLFSVSGGGKIVSIPSQERGQQSFHADCFRCDACRGTFAEKEGAASFVKFEGGVRHLECTPTKQMKIYKHPSQESMPVSREFGLKASVGQEDTLKKSIARPSPSGHVASSSPSQPSSIPRPSFAAHHSHSSSASIASLSSSSMGIGPSSASPTVPLTPRFGSATACPGCRLTVSPMERGIVPGPGATKWHAACLICGGKRTTTAGKRSSGVWTSGDGRNESSGCGKRLDSAAKGDAARDGVVWCRDCWDKTRGLCSPSPSMTAPQGIFPSSSSSSRPNSALGLNNMSGSTTMARQLTRGSGSTSPLRRHFQIAAPEHGTISEGDVMTNFDEEGGEGDGDGLTDRRRPASVASQYLRASSPLKMHFTGMGGYQSRPASPVRPQTTGTGLNGGRSTSPVRRQYTGALNGSPVAEEQQPLAIQYTGGGVPVTRQLTTTGRRPRSVLGMRSIGSQKSVDEGRGMFLVRQMTGQQQSLA